MTAIEDAKALTPSQSAFPAVPNAIGELDDLIAALVLGNLTSQLTWDAIEQTIGANKVLTSGDGILQVIKASAPGLAVVLPDATTWIEGRAFTIVNRPDRDEVQRLTFTGAPTGGTFKLTFDAQETAAITYSVTPGTLAGNIQAALNALSNLSEVVVAHVLGADYDVTFAGADGGTDQSLMTLSENLLTGGTAPSLTIAERFKGYAAGNNYAIHDNSGRVLLGDLRPGGRAVCSLIDDTTAAGEWHLALDAERDLMAKLDVTVADAEKALTINAAGDGLIKVLPALKHIKTEAPTVAVSEISFDNTVLTTDFAVYLILHEDLKHDAVGNLVLRTQVSTDNGTSWVGGTAYNYAAGSDNDAGVGGQPASTGTDRWQLTGSMGDAATEGGIGFALLFHPRNASLKTRIIFFALAENAGGTALEFQGGGGQVDAADNDAIRFFVSGANMDVGSRISIYGVRL